MFDEPEEKPPERPQDPADRAREKSDGFRVHAEFAAVFEGTRKFDAAVRNDLDPNLARDIQRTIGKLEKAKLADTPLLAPESSDDAKRILNLPESNELPTNDYHVNHRPGETIIARWLTGDEVEAFYARLQAHFDAALGQFREEEHQQLAWKRDPTTLAYLGALDKIDLKMPERYLREPLRTHEVFVLSTQAADELDLLHLTDYVMGVAPEDIVGRASAPPEDGATEKDRTWFFKLFSLRGTIESVERMCFFAYLQKTDDDAW